MTNVLIINSCLLLTGPRSRLAFIGSLLRYAFKGQEVWKEGRGENYDHDGVAYAIGSARAQELLTGIRPQFRLL